MIVSCSSCATKFHVPDAKVAGKRARMTCKKCKNPIDIDGSGLLPLGGHATPPSRPEPSRPKNEPLAVPPAGISPRWRVAEPSGNRQEMSLDILADRYASGGFEPGTLVCQPGENRWMPPYDYPEVMSKASPLEPSAPSHPTFTDETVALSRAESAALTRQAQPSYPDLDTGRAPPHPGQRESFFDGADVAGAMRSFDLISGGLPPSSASPERARPGRPATMPSVQVPPSPAGGWATAPVRPSPPASPSRPPVMHAVAPPPHVSPVAPASLPAGLGAMRPSAPPPPSASLRPSAPPMAPPPVPSVAATLHPRTAGAAVQAFPLPTTPQYAPFGEPSSTHVYHTRPMGSQAPLLHSVPATRHIPSAPPLAPAPRLLRPTTDSGLSGYGGVDTGLSRIEQRSSGSGGLFAAFLSMVLLGGAVGGIYLFQPALFERGTVAVQSLLGLAPAPSTSAAFDETAAGLVLGEAAEQTSVCRKGDGPIGKGRVRVLYQTDGRAQKVAVSEPFHKSAVGDCLVEHFKRTKVPPFGGEPVIVNKTFELK